MVDGLLLQAEYQYEEFDSSAGDYEVSLDLNQEGEHLYIYMCLRFVAGYF